MQKGKAGVKIFKEILRFAGRGDHVMHTTNLCVKDQPHVTLDHGCSKYSITWLMECANLSLKNSLSLGTTRSSSLVSLLEQKQLFFKCYWCFSMMTCILLSSVIFWEMNHTCRCMNNLSWHSNTIWTLIWRNSTCSLIVFFRTSYLFVYSYAFPVPCRPRSPLHLNNLCFVFLFEENNCNNFLQIWKDTFCSIKYD